MSDAGDLLTAMSRRGLRDIQFYWLFATLNATNEFLDDTFRILDQLLEEGLQVSTAKSADGGSLVECKRARKALADIEQRYDADDASFDPERAWIDVRCGEVSVGNLWVSERNFAETCDKIGAETYWWPKVQWPRGVEDLEERRTANSSQTPPTMIEDYDDTAEFQPDSGGAPNLLERRCTRLKAWLGDQDVPETKWLQLEGWSLRAVYDELKKAEEFLTPDGLQLSFATFKRHFWRKQTICKLVGTAKHR